MNKDLYIELLENELLTARQRLTQTEDKLNYNIQLNEILLKQADAFKGDNNVQA